MTRARKPAVVIAAIYGDCPVQAEGTVEGKRFTFRARGSRWDFHIEGDDPLHPSEWWHEEAYGERFDAGYMPHKEAEAFIRREAARYARGEEGGRLDE